MSQTTALPTSSAIYAFGDSLSDAGNLSVLTKLTGTEPVSPPYYQEKYGAISGNVFSNGPTWVQDLSTALKLGTLAPSLVGGTDFAYGGAETGLTPQNANDTEIQAISLPSQILQFQAAVPQPSANAIYTLSIGSNDLLDILGATGLTTQQQTTDVNAAVANEIAFIKQLAGDGAKNLLVLNVPDLGKVPDITEGIVNGSNTPSAALDAEASQLAAQYNTDLDSQLTSLASADSLNVHVVDAYQLINNVVADPAPYGLTNVTSPVWSGNYTSSTSGTLAATGSAAQDQYLFWDHLHPTETGHQQIAAAAEVELSGSAATSQITQFYNNILQRAPDPAGLLYWDTAVDSGAQTLAQAEYAIATSTESEANVVPIVELYTVFNRAPDAAGLQYWVGALRGGESLTSIAGSFLTSAEGQKIYGTTVGTNPAANIAFLDTAYQNVLGRAPDAAGEQYWAGQLNAGISTPAQVLASMVESSEAQVRDATPVTNFLLAAGEGTADYSGNLFAPSGAAVAAVSSAGGSTFDLGTSAAQAITLGTHSAADTIVVGSDHDAVYGSGNVVAINNFTIGSTSGTSDVLEFLAGGATAVAVTGVSGTFGSGINGTDLSNLTASAAAGVLTFTGSAASTDTMAQLVAAAANVLDTLPNPANTATAFQYNGSTYLVVTPNAPGAGTGFSLATDHVFDLSGVTGATAIGTVAGAHSILV